METRSSEIWTTGRFGEVVEESGGIEGFDEGVMGSARTKRSVSYGRRLCVESTILVFPAAYWQVLRSAVNGLYVPKNSPGLHRSLYRRFSPHYSLDICSLGFYIRERG